MPSNSSLTPWAPPITGSDAFPFRDLTDSIEAPLA